MPKSRKILDLIVEGYRTTANCECCDCLIKEGDKSVNGCCEKCVKEKKAKKLGESHSKYPHIDAALKILDDDALWE